MVVFCQSASVHENIRSGEFVEKEKNQKEKALGWP